MCGFKSTEQQCEGECALLNNQHDYYKLPLKFFVVPADLCMWGSLNFSDTLDTSQAALVLTAQLCMK